ncbi:MAG: hypothetical protein Q9183_004013 [Haloplaca sp. 2 TL-2023]
MSGSFEKSVKGGTKIKLAAPKAKYVEHILVATHAGEAGVAEIFRALQNRLRDSTWTIVFKALILVHLMIREGEPNVTLKFLADTPSKLAISNFSDVQAQGINIRHYYSYVLSRAKAFRDTKIDWVREGQSRLKKQTVSKGLLRETKIVQSQISALLKCDVSVAKGMVLVVANGVSTKFLSNDPENEVTLTAFRLLTMDLLVLFGIMNEGTINVLGEKCWTIFRRLRTDIRVEHYFEMSKYDAEQALDIYKNFGRQTDRVVQFLNVARQHENSTRLEIPKLKHAPTGLTTALEEYLNDPNFESNRREFLARQDAEKGKPSTHGSSSKPAAKLPKDISSGAFPEPKNATSAPVVSQARQEPPKGPAPDLIDFFESIEQNQQPMATYPQQGPTFQNNTQPFQQPQPSGFSSAQSPFPNGGVPPQQQSGNTMSQSNPFGQYGNQAPQLAQPDTGATFGSFPQQFSGYPQNQFTPVPQNNTSQSFNQPQQQQFTGFQQPFDTGQSSQQPSNPFRQQTPMATGASSSSLPNSSASPLNRQSTNPFARSSPMSPLGQTQNSPFNSAPPQQPSQSFSQPSSQPFSQPGSQTFSPPMSQTLQPQATGTNPFARTMSPPSSQFSTPPPMMPNVTGSTNPFRQSTFVNQQPGQGWQSNQGSMGGLEHMNTVPVFPRPGQPQQQQQQPPPPWP